VVAGATLSLSHKTRGCLVSPLYPISKSFQFSPFQKSFSFFFLVFKKKFLFLFFSFLRSLLRKGKKKGEPPPQLIHFLGAKFRQNAKYIYIYSRFSEFKKKKLAIFGLYI